MAFADAFTFTRPNSAPYVDATGIVHTAAPNHPGFFHGLGGLPTGLLVAVGGAAVQPDRAGAIAGDWASLATATVLHEFDSGAGVRARAHYTTRPKAMIDGCLAIAAHHRRVAVYPGYLRNYGGWVWTLGRRWYLPAGVSAGAGAVLATGDGAPIIGA